jgi:Tol biopolymer transport system component
MTFGRVHTPTYTPEGEDRNPVVSPDGQTIYFLSERDGGSFNVYYFRCLSHRISKKLPNSSPTPYVSSPSARTGRCVMDTMGNLHPEKRESSSEGPGGIIRDDQPQTTFLKYTDGATSATISPDGKQVAFVLRGEVFVTSADYATTKQITHTPAREAGLTSFPTTVPLHTPVNVTATGNFASPKLPERKIPTSRTATLINEEILLPSATVERTYPQFSPDGKELAFIEDRNRLMVVNLESKQVRRNHRRFNVVQYLRRVQLRMVARREVVYPRIHREQARSLFRHRARQRQWQR